MTTRKKYWITLSAILVITAISVGIAWVYNEWPAFFIVFFMLWARNIEKNLNELGDRIRSENIEKYFK